MEVLEYKVRDSYKIKVSTTDITNPWKKFRVRAKETAPDEYCEYTSNTDGLLSLYDYSSKSLQPIEETQWKKMRPVFFETNCYNITIYFYHIKKGYKPHIIHPDKNVSEMFSCDMFDNKAILSGSINFLNEPGRFSLKYSYTTEEGLDITDNLDFDVVSPKLDTKNDLNIIIQQIKAEYDDLVFRYLSLTFQQFSLGREANNDIIWLSVFKKIIDGYINAVRYIIHRPHLKDTRTENYLRAEKIKRWPSDLSEKFYNDYYGNKNKALHNFYQITEIDSTEDTRENRFVKYTIDRICSKLNSVIMKIKASNGGRISDEEKNDLKDKLKELDKLKRASLFRTIGRFDGFRQESIILQQRTGYAQVYRYWIILQNGLNLIDGNTSVGVLPIWKLYELWCFLKIKQLVREILNIDTKNKEDFHYIHENTNTMFEPFAGSNMNDTVVYENKDNGDKVELGYQYSYVLDDSCDKIHSMTVEQKPDIVMHIHKKDKGFCLTYLFDAKYRVEGDDNEAQNKSVIDYPKQETLNQMHRYRDAIYYGNRKNNNFAKEVIGAYILFPGRMNENTAQIKIDNNDFTGLPYYIRSIHDVNIGAYPLLPNNNSGLLLKNQLEKIIKGQSIREQIIDSVPQKGLYYSDTKPKEKLVFIGNVKNDNQFITDFVNNTASMFYTGPEVDKNTDVQSIGYLMPIVDYKVQGVYDITAINSARKSKKGVNSNNSNDEMRLFFMLGDFIEFGTEKVAIKNRLHYGILCTYEQAKKIYIALKENNLDEVNSILSDK